MSLTALFALAAASYAPYGARAGSLSRVAAPPVVGRPALVSRAHLSARVPLAVGEAPDAELPVAMRPRTRANERARLAAAAARAVLGAATMLAASPVLAAASAAAVAPKLHIGQKLALKLSSTGLSNEAVLVLISMLPVVELRGAVPVGSWLGVPPLRTLLVCVLGNTLAVLLLLAALRLPLVESLLRPLLNKAKSKMGGLADSKSLPLGLAVFVGVPLPGTGGWTGAMVAHLLGMPFGLAAASIFGGVVMAGLIMTALTLAGWYGAIVAGGVLGLFCVGALLRRSSE